MKQIVENETNYAACLKNAADFVVAETYKQNFYGDFKGFRTCEGSYFEIE